MSILPDWTSDPELDPTKVAVGVGTDIEIDVTEDNYTIETTQGSDITVSSECTVTPENSDVTVEVVKKEYSIVGDGLYASISANEAPQWLTGIIDTLVDQSVTAGMVDYDLLVQDVRSAIDALDVAQNTYVEKIDFTADVDTIVGSHLDTLNATLENTYATIVNLDTVVADADSALATAISDVTSAYTNEINSQITTIQSAYTSADAALASDITALTVAFEDQEANLSGTADAVSGLQTYVGLDPDGVPNTSGMLLRLDELEDQTDGIIEYFFYENYTEIPGAVSEATALDIIAAGWGNSQNSNVVYFKDTTNAYWYQSSSASWLTVTDTSLYQALQNAATAQSTADGIVVSYYAWDQSTAPATTYLWLTDANILQKYNGSSWVTVDAKEGDTLTAYDDTTKDVAFYEYQSGNWVRITTDGIVANSKAFTDLDLALSDLDDSVFGTSGLEQSLNAAITDEGARVESKFEYDSTIGINGTYYTAGFGLVSTATGGDGTEGNPYDSEFWVNAETFKLKSPSYPGIEATFTVTAEGLYLGLDHTEATRNLPRGGYSAGTTYYLGDTVTYNGSSYVALKTLTGITPVDGTDWQLLASIGDTGPQGIQGIQGIQGPTGPSGDDGADGVRGTATLTYAVNLGSLSPASIGSTSIASYWNSAATAAYDTEITGDILVLTNTNTTAGWTHIYEFNGTSWVSATDFIVNGNAVVTGTLAADKLVANSITSTQLSTGTLITTSAQIGSAVISTANIGTAQVDTLQIAGDAVTVPEASSASINHTGPTGYTFTDYVTLDTAGVIFASGAITQGFNGSYGSWSVSLVIDGLTVMTTGTVTGDWQQAVGLSGGKACAAGTRAVQIVWTGSTANQTLGQVSLYAVGAKR